MKRCQKLKTSYSQRNDVENSKGFSLRNGQKPVRGCLAAKPVSKTQKASRCETAKNPLGDARSFGVKTDKNEAKLT